MEDGTIFGMSEEELTVWCQAWEPEPYCPEETQEEPEDWTV